MIIIELLLSWCGLSSPHFLTGYTRGWIDSTNTSDGPFLL